MATDYVIVDGVTLTRAQVEKALEQLNHPELVAGDVYHCSLSGTSYVALGGGNGEVVTGRGSVTTMTLRADCDSRVGSLNEIVRFYREAKGL